MPVRISQSTKKKNSAVSSAMMKTMIEVSVTSRRVGQTTLDTSVRTCWMNCKGLVRAMDDLPDLIWGQIRVSGAHFKRHVTKLDPLQRAGRSDTL